MPDVLTDELGGSLKDTQDGATPFLRLRERFLNHAVPRFRYGLNLGRGLFNLRSIIYVAWMDRRSQNR